MRLTKKLRDKHRDVLNKIEFDLGITFPHLDTSTIELISRIILKEELMQVEESK